MTKPLSFTHRALIHLHQRVGPSCSVQAFVSPERILSTATWYWCFCFLAAVLKAEAQARGTHVVPLSFPQGLYKPGIQKMLHRALFGAILPGHPTAEHPRYMHL